MAINGSEITFTPKFVSSEKSGSDCSEDLVMTRDLPESNFFRFTYSHSVNGARPLHPKVY